MRNPVWDLKKKKKKAGKRDHYSPECIAPVKIQGSIQLSGVLLKRSLLHSCRLIPSKATSPEMLTFTMTVGWAPPPHLCMCYWLTLVMVASLIFVSSDFPTIKELLQGKTGKGVDKIGWKSFLLLIQEVASVFLTESWLTHLIRIIISLSLLPNQGC